jgi:magnesium-transporting ATPase (P-type)
MQEELNRPEWHVLAAEEVLARQESRPQGLTETEAQQRLLAHGPNRLPPAKRRGPLLRFLAQFHNVLIYVLLAAAVVTALLGHWVDCGVILGVVVVNALIGFIQEGRRRGLWSRSASCSPDCKGAFPYR